MENLSVKTRDILLQAGWNPNNKINVTKSVMFLETMGYQVNDSVIDVLGKNASSLYKFGDNIFEALDTLCLYKIPEEIN
ncbi:hypothetical protein [Lysinibacillus sp. NPDC096212]|uniref:hypothetical protein n=1 Tax=Lysinibacillus sp. NPDC096212 TaxID=3364135 RepID=UPI00380E9B6E